MAGLWKQDAILTGIALSLCCRVQIVASFSPSPATASASAYSSSQEALRALLHSVVKVPEVKGAVVELNGVHLTHALLSYTHLALKCAQHYSWSDRPPHPPTP